MIMFRSWWYLCNAFVFDWSSVYKFLFQIWCLHSREQ